MEQLVVTLDPNDKKPMADEVIRIMMGVETLGDWSGLSPTPAVMNPISNSVTWNYFHLNPDNYQFAHATHNFDRSWLDINDPEYPA